VLSQMCKVGRGRCVVARVSENKKKTRMSMSPRCRVLSAEVSASSRRRGGASRGGHDSNSVTRMSVTVT
jgi:hypothetical protein